MVWEAKAAICANSEDCVDPAGLESQCNAVGALPEAMYLAADGCHILRLWKATSGDHQHHAERDASRIHHGTPSFPTRPILIGHLRHGQPRPMESQCRPSGVEGDVRRLTVQPPGERPGLS